MVHPDLIADFDLEDIHWEGGRALYSWWLQARGDKIFPARADFEPTDFMEHLPTMQLHDVGEGDPTPFPVRLIGTKIVDVLGHDPTREPIQSVSGGDVLKERFDWLLENKKPYMCKRLPIFWANKDYQQYSTLVLPLGPDGNTVDMLIANLCFE